MTSKYPDVAALFPKVLAPGVRSIVFDAEVVAADRDTQKLLPFQASQWRPAGGLAWRPACSRYVCLPGCVHLRRLCLRGCAPLRCIWHGLSCLCLSLPPFPVCTCRC
jgi:hypothetical protein